MSAWRPTVQWWHGSQKRTVFRAQKSHIILKCPVKTALLQPIKLFCTAWLALPLVLSHKSGLTFYKRYTKNLPESIASANLSEHTPGAKTWMLAKMRPAKQCAKIMVEGRFCWLSKTIKIWNKIVRQPAQVSTVFYNLYYVRILRWTCKRLQVETKL